MLFTKNNFELYERSNNVMSQLVASAQRIIDGKSEFESFDYIPNYWCREINSPLMMEAFVDYKFVCLLKPRYPGNSIGLMLVYSIIRQRQQRPNPQLMVPRAQVPYVLKTPLASEGGSSSPQA